MRGGGGADARAAQHGFDAQHELRDREGFGDVVVGAEREPVDDVFVARLRREHDDRLIAVDLADFVADRKAVSARQHDVEQQQVVAPAERLLEAQSLPSATASTL